MKYDDLTSILVRNTVTAYRGGHLREDQVLSALSLAAAQGDREAGALLDECRAKGVAGVLGGKTG